MVKLEENVKEYIKERFNEGMIIKDIVKAVKRDCFIKTSYDTVRKYLHESGLLSKSVTQVHGVEDRKVERDLARNIKLIAYFKTATKGDVIEYVEPSKWVGGTYTPKEDTLRKRKATVIKCYYSYIHTNNGCVQYSDVRRLIKNGKKEVSR